MLQYLWYYCFGRYNNDIAALFVMSAVVCTVLEYLTSLVMEKLFHARWWDYSNRKFNVNGRVCLVNSLFFGILGCLLVHFINPFVSGILSSFSNTALYITGFVLLAIFLADSIISIYIMFKFKFTTDNIHKDHTEEIADEITKRVREALSNKSYLHKRLINAFPDMRAVLKEQKIKIEKYIDEKKTEIDEKQEQLKQKQKEFQKAFKENVKKLPKNKK